MVMNPPDAVQQNPHETPQARPGPVKPAACKGLLFVLWFELPDHL